MAASNTDLVRQAAPNFATTLANSMLISDTTMTLQTATGLPTSTGITLVVDATDPVSGATTANLKEVITGTLSGSVVSNLVRGLDGTSQQAHAAGANVTMWITANLWNDFQTSYLAQHNQLGTHTGITTNTITTTGNASIGGTLGVTGASTFTGAATFSVPPTFTGGLNSSVLSNPYKFSVYLASNQTGIADSTFAKVLFDTKLFDTNNNFSSNKYTVPVTGFYQINAYLSIVSANNTGVAGLGSLYKNGVEFIRADAGYPTNGVGASTQTISKISEIISLTAGDYLECYVFFDVSSSTVTVTGGLPSSSRFSGFLVSAT